MKERLAFGLKKIDHILQGGIPKETCVSVTGPPGVGKSLLATHFLLEGLANGEKCVYIHLNEPESSIERMIQSFGFGSQLIEYQQKELFVIRGLESDIFSKRLTEIPGRLSEEKYSRVVIDGFNVMIADMDNASFRNNMRIFLEKLREKGRTSLIVSEMDNHNLSNLEKMFLYSVDGIIFLHFMHFGHDLQRSLFIPKMRFTKLEDCEPSFSITEKGIEIVRS